MKKSAVFSYLIIQAVRSKVEQRFIFSFIKRNVRLALRVAATSAVYCWYSVHVRILSSYLVECIMQRVDFPLCLLLAETVLNRRICHDQHNLFHMFVFLFSACLTAQVTYTFMNLLPDDDEGVGQRAHAGLVLRLSRCVVAEHPLHVKTQHKSQETASLADLTQRSRPVREMLSHILLGYKAQV